MDENYFGNITVPDNEEEEDAANDLTFGDIGDVKAGDEASDALWKPDHASLSSKIEAEKEALQRSRLSSRPHLNGTPNDVKQTPPHHPPQHSPRNGMTPGSPARWPQHQSPLAQMRPQPPPVSPVEYQRSMIAYQEQQTQLLLRSHQETAERQLQEAQRAQQAGITFDRKKFDQHQAATRQMIMNDHYSRVRQIQLMVWHQGQQQMQQSAGMSGPRLNGSPYHERPRPAPDAAARSPPVTGRPGSFGGERPLNLNPLQSSPRTAQPADRGLTRPTVSYGQAHSPVNGMPEKAARMLEIERQMAEAGLGPKSSAFEQSRMDQFRVSRVVDSDENSKPAKKSERRLESMTDRDQELVFRVHLRQLESSVVYKDDYYNSVLRMKEKLGGQEIFSDLAEKVQGMRIRSQQRTQGSASIRIRSPRGGNGESGSHQLASSPPHSGHNMRALANALGTLQSWNPRAPRRVMDFGLLEKREPVEGAPHKSLREDERVHVRQEIEKGYDIIATIHDIARGESSEPLSMHTQALMSTLDLAERVEPGNGPKVTLQSTRFFATMCIIEKGRRYLARVLPLLETSDRGRAMSAVFENLGMLVFASKKMGSASEATSESELFRVVAKTVQESDCHDCLQMLDAFSASHTPHRDAFLTAFRSSLGSRLIFLCTQRISGGLLKNKFDEEEVSRAKVERFSDAFTGCLQDIFEDAESVGRVWEVTASIDALAKDDHRTKYRAQLNRLLRSGAIPPPPTK